MLPDLNLPIHDQRLTNENGRQMIFCRVRKKHLVLTPEEWVRQNLISYLNLDLGYPVSLMKIEKQVKGGNRIKRADLVICDSNGKANMLVECKSPSEKLNRETFFQVGRYNRHISASLLLISNGLVHFCCEVIGNEFNFLESIPQYTP